MTATDELRRMLDERGVEYVLNDEYAEKYPPEQSVTWSCDLAGEDMTVTARDYLIGINEDGSSEYCLDLEFHEVFTPAQAVAATLGAGTCHDKNGFDPDTGFECTVCGAMVDRYMITPNDTGHEVQFHYCPFCGREVDE